MRSVANLVRLPQRIAVRIIAADGRPMLVAGQASSADTSGIESPGRRVARSTTSTNFPRVRRITQPGARSLQRRPDNTSTSVNYSSVSFDRAIFCPVAQVGPDMPAEIEMKNDASLDPGYTELDIADVLARGRMLAAVDAYAHDKITMGHVYSLYPQSSTETAVPQKFRGNAAAYQRMIQEIARRLLAGTISVPDDIYQQYPEVQAQFGKPMSGSLPKYKFSELEAMSPELSPLTVRRDTYDDADIAVVLSKLKNLACLDAYCKGLTNFTEARRRMFGNRHYLPLNLSDSALLDLAFEVCRRIGDGRLVVPASLRDQHPKAYMPQERKDIR